MRKFKCIGLEEKDVYCWNIYFEVGRTYDLVLDDGSTYIKLIDNAGDDMWVDRDQFEEVMPE